MAAKDPCGMFLQKYCSLDELRYQKFIAFLMGDLVDSSSDVAYGENYGNYFEESIRKCERENDGNGVRSNQLIGFSDVYLLY